MIAPITTLTPQGTADTGYAGNHWQFNTKGEIVGVHRQYKKTVFTPSNSQCPAPTEQLEDYGKTTSRFKNGTTNTLDHKYQAWTFHSKHNNRCRKERQFSGSRKAQHCQRHCSNSLQQNTAKQRKVTPHHSSDTKTICRAPETKR